MFRALDTRKLLHRGLGFVGKVQGTRRVSDLLYKSRIRRQPPPRHCQPLYPQPRSGNTPLACIKSVYQDYAAV